VALLLEKAGPQNSFFQGRCHPVPAPRSFDEGYHPHLPQDRIGPRIEAHAYLEEIFHITDVDLQHLHRGKDSYGVAVDGWDSSRECFQFLSGFLDRPNPSIEFLNLFSSHHVPLTSIMKVNSNSKIPNPKYIPNTNSKWPKQFPLEFRILVIGNYLEFGACHLVLLYLIHVSLGL
jgi:hypothetical protein